MTYSTTFEFNNPTNSRKSLFSGIGVAAVAKIEHYFQALLRRQAGVAARIGFFGIGEAVKYLDRLLHLNIIRASHPSTRWPQSTKDGRLPRWPLLFYIGRQSRMSRLWSLVFVSLLPLIAQ